MITNSIYTHAANASTIGLHCNVMTAEIWITVNGLGAPSKCS